MATNDLSFLYKKYKGQWVSISKDYSEVLASSKNFDELLEELKSKNFKKKGVIMKVPKRKYSSYAG